MSSEFDLNVSRLQSVSPANWKPVTKAQSKIQMWQKENFAKIYVFMWHTIQKNIFTALITIFTLIKYCNNSPSSNSYLLPWPCDYGGGTELPGGCYMSLCSPPASPPLLGHRTKRSGHQPLLWEWGSLLALLPAPPEELERQKAGLSSVAPNFTEPPQAHKQPGGALWVFIPLYRCGVPLMSQSNQSIKKAQLQPEKWAHKKKSCTE